MATQTPKPVTHIFKEVNRSKFLSVKHFELTSVSNGNSQLSELINISKNRNCAMSMPDYWLKIRQGPKWSKCITGLFKTAKQDLYKGDHNKRQHLLIFKFSDADTLTIYYFKNYFTTDLTKVLPFIN